jgi:glutamyl/glutaminyl-tRNA synthetase
MSHNNQYNKTRLAPTPSGFLHLGNVLSFAVTAALARKTGAKLLLRIDDLDQARVNKQYVQDIFDTLIFLGIPWDEGPRNPAEFEEVYSQMHRAGMYNQVLQQLAGEGKVFACTCSRSQLKGDQPCQCFKRKIPLNTENASWRLTTENQPEPEVKSYKGKIIRAALPADMENFVVKKKDGFPAYQLTSLVDDLYYGVDLVVRGEDLWPSTLAQHVLASALGGNNLSDITFYHHPLLMEADGKKLSKSAGALSVKCLHESGKTPADVYGLIAAMAGITDAVDSWEQLAELIICGTK